MSVKLDNLSDSDLELLANGQMDKMSDAGLSILAGETKIPKFSTVAEANAAMQSANKDQKQAEYNASWPGVIDRSSGRFLNPLTQNILGAGQSLTGGLSGQIPLYKQMSEPEGFAYNAGRVAGAIPVGGMATKAVAQAIPALAGQGLRASLGRNILAGGLAGAYTVPEDRTTGAVAGMISGGLFTPVERIVKGGISTYKKVTGVFQKDKLLPSVNELKASSESLKTNISSLQTEIDKLRDAQTIRSQRGTVLTTKAREVATKAEKVYSNAINSSSEALRSMTDDLSSQLKVKTNALPATVKKTGVSFYRNASTAYGEVRDSILDTLDDPLRAGSLLKKDAPPVNGEEVYNQAKLILDNFKDDPSIVATNGYKAVEEFAEKYAQKGANSVDFKTLLGDVKLVEKTIASGIKSGSKAVGADDLVATRFSYSVGEILKDRVPKFAELQRSYKPIIDTKNLFYKTFQPNNGLTTNQSVALFKRIAGGNATPRDVELISILEKGSNVGGKRVEGLGEFTAEIRQIGQQLTEAGKKFNMDKKAAEAAKSLDISRMKDIQLYITKRVAQSGLDKTQKIMKIEETMSGVKGSLSELEKKLVERANVDEFKRKLMWSALRGAGLTGATILGSRALRE